MEECTYKRTHTESHTCRDINAEETYTRKGHIHGGKYTQRDIHTEGHKGWVDYF